MPFRVLNQMSITRWEKYSPVGIGLEDMFRRLDAFSDSAAQNYPPYNIIRLPEGGQQLQLALAGFMKEDIEVAVEDGVLQISVRKTYETEGEYIHKGIAQRSFSRNWQLSPDTVVQDVTYIDGLLRVTLIKVVPEEKQRKILDIG